MELPFLKNKRRNDGGGGPVAEIEREPDSSGPSQMLESVADEILDAYHRGDQRALFEALSAFVLMTQDEDQSDG